MATITTISEVKDAMERGDREAAIEKISALLKKRPSAEGWYLAAKLVTDPSKKRTFLRRSLMLDKNYQPARAMLAHLKGQKMLRTSNIFEVIRDEIATDRKSATQPKKPAALKNLQAAAVAPEESADDGRSIGFNWQHVAVMVLMVVVALLAGNLIFSAGNDEPVAAAPNASASAAEIVVLDVVPEHSVVASEALLNAYTNAGYRPLAVVPDEGSTALQKFAMATTIDGRTDYIFLYIFTTKPTSDDQRAVLNHLPNHGTDASANMILATPNDIDEATSLDVLMIFLDKTQMIDS